jgi:hypothetical protein
VSHSRKVYNPRRINNCMNRNDDPLVSREVSIRRDQERKRKTAQHKEMENREINRESNAFHQSVDASNDEYMKNALMKVRQSNVTHSETLTRMNGTWMHNQNLKP